ncbi:MAG: hypothetical protein EON58_06145 [Alphaproteobacteria bacterium]|nr:MAG: hypothetical protein EON58_06145 [Alphaproteobacteria bacterium]
MAWPETIRTSVYNVVQSIRYGPDNADIFVAVGRWIISYWFFCALAVLFISWLVALALAVFDSSASLLERTIWGLVIFFGATFFVILYCLLMLLRPNNSFKPSPHQGGA